MTYCVGIATREGFVVASDSRSNAGYDQINVCRKMHLFVRPGERLFAVLSSGSLSCCQSVLTLLRRDFDRGVGLGGPPQHVGVAQAAADAAGNPSAASTSTDNEVTVSHPVSPPPPPVNGDRFAVATGPGVPVRVTIFTPDGTARITLAPFGDFAGGATVATADVTGDGIDDVVVGAGPGGGPHVKVFSGVDLTELASFYAFDPTFRTGANVGVGAAGTSSDGISSGEGSGNTVAARPRLPSTTMAAAAGPRPSMTHSWR